MPRPSRQVIYERLERGVADLSAMGGLPSVEEAKGTWEAIWQEEAHHSTAMEGNTLIEREVQLLLFEGKAVGSRSFKDYLEVQGYADAAHWVYGQAVKAPATALDLTITDIREIHRRLVAPVWPHFPPENADPRDRPGDFRHSNIEPLRPGLVPPQWPHLSALVHDWVRRANSIVGITSAPHLVEDLADLHAELERIHPFSDGNGRLGRLVLNLLLVRYGYPPAVIRKTHRQRYLEALQKADDGDPGLLGEVLARSVKHGIDRFLIPGLAGPMRYVPLSALTHLGFSHNALVLAAKRGRLEAAERNGQWYSSQACVEEYARSRYKRKPKEPATR